MYREDGIKLQRYKTQNQLPVQIFVLIRSIAQLYKRVSTIEVAPPPSPVFFINTISDYGPGFSIRNTIATPLFYVTKILKLVLCSYP